MPCSHHCAFLLFGEHGRQAEFIRARSHSSSSESRNLQSLRAPSPIGCAGTLPSRAIFINVRWLRSRNLAASVASTKYSRNSNAPRRRIGAFASPKHVSPFLSIALNTWIAPEIKSSAFLRPISEQLGECHWWAELD